MGDKMLGPDAMLVTLDGALTLGLLTQQERASIKGALDDTFALREVVRLADSLHAHVKVDETDALPHVALRTLGGVVENSKAGYVKYAFESGLNLIFSSIAVSQDDLRETKAPETRRARPFLDHLGIDVRRLDDTTRAVFARVPEIASRRALAHVPQGGVDKAVFCCHTSVAAKHWVFPDGKSLTVPVEVALGPLTIEVDKSGCDLRPSRPEARRLPVSSDCC